MSGQIIFFVLVATWVAFDTYILITRDGRQRLPVEERVSKFVMVSCIIVVMALPVMLSESAQAAWQEPFGPLRRFGLLVMLSGILGRVYIIRWFGAGFTVEVRTPSHLHTSGPYRHIRHPAYAAELTIALGVALAFLHPITSLPAIILPTFGLLFRIRAEERVLRKTLGEDYHRYAARTKRLIPFVY